MWWRGQGGCARQRDDVTVARKLTRRRGRFLSFLLPRQSKRDILDLSRHVDKRVHVKFQGGREVTGTLRGYDQLVNIVLDDTVEHLRDPARPEVVTDKTRHLGLVVCRGNSVTLVCPADGLIETSNPYAETEAPE